jgi:hypothetical protein
VISAVGRFTKNFGESLPAPVYLALQFVLVGIPIVLVCGLYFVMLEKPCMRRDWPQQAWVWIADKFVAKTNAERSQAEAA